MDGIKVMALLVDIDRLVGKGDPMVIREMIMAAQDGVLRLQQQLVATLENNGRLRDQLEICGKMSLSRPLQLDGSRVAAHLEFPEAQIHLHPQ